MVPTPEDYAERVYAGVLGKAIGVYAGAPFEGWSHEAIAGRFGEIDRYVHAEVGRPVVAPDDDISGTFTFFRALEEHGFDPALTSKQIGDTWLNLVLEGRTILWWGGVGMSTEHTAYHRLKQGIPAPESGSIALNGRQVAEQIGAQIFIDAWGLLCPGDPERAADFAQRAARVSHDGEAVFAARVVAALVALAFTSKDVRYMVDAGAESAPPDSTIAAVIRDVCAWYDQGLDWRSGFARIRERYGYDRYPGPCHVVPNHAVVIHALLHGAGDFGRTLLVANGCGWDTDCNSGNAGCIAGVFGGLAGLDAGYDWRGPVGDRLYLPSADGGRCVTDAVREALEIVRAHHRMRGEPCAETPRNALCFPGSTQGFASGDAALANDGSGLAIRPYGERGRALTAVFPPSEAFNLGGYSMVASPSLYPGQVLRARAAGSGRARLVVAGNGPGDVPVESRGPWTGPEADLVWRVPANAGYPILEAGVEVEGPEARLEWLTWDGEPEADLGAPETGELWRRAWVCGASEMSHSLAPFVVTQNGGPALVTQGERSWRNVAVEARVRTPLAASVGVALHVQGLRRYVALRLDADGMARLVLVYDSERVLAQATFDWRSCQTLTLRLEGYGAELLGSVNEMDLLRASDSTLECGAIGLLLAEGTVIVDSVRVSPSGPDASLQWTRPELSELPP
jgi:ADP-ribosylglycohydrolase